MSWLREHVRALGIGATGLLLLAKLLARLSKRSRLVYYHIVVQPVTAKPRLPAHRAKQFQFRVIDAWDDVLHALPRPTEVMQQRFKNGSHCMVAEQDGGFAGCIWWQPGAYQEDEVRSLFQLPDAQMVWDYDVYVCPEHRQGLLFTKLWDTTSVHLAQQGINASASRILGFNAASLNSHRRLGAMTVSKAVYLVFGGLQITFTTQKPRLHIGADPDQTPEIPIERS